jgi:hypothetical protein
MGSMSLNGRPLKMPFKFYLFLTCPQKRKKLPFSFLTEQFGQITKASNQGSVALPSAIGARI